MISTDNKNKAVVKQPTAESDLSSAEEPIVADERIPVMNGRDNESDGDNFGGNTGDEIERRGDISGAVAEQDLH